MKDEKKDNPAEEKSFSSALRIVKLYQHPIKIYYGKTIQQYFSTVPN